MNLLSGVYLCISAVVYLSWVLGATPPGPFLRTEGESLQLATWPRPRRRRSPSEGCMIDCQSSVSSALHLLRASPKLPSGTVLLWIQRVCRTDNRKESGIRTMTHGNRPRLRGASKHRFLLRLQSYFRCYLTMSHVQ